MNPRRAPNVRAVTTLGHHTQRHPAIGGRYARLSHRDLNGELRLDNIRFAVKPFSAGGQDVAGDMRSLGASDRRRDGLQLERHEPAGIGKYTASPVVLPSASSPSVSPSAVVSSCTEANATDLTADDPYTIVIQDFRFKPKCFMADFAAASIAIENKDDVAHTFTIDGTLVNAPLRPTRRTSTGLEPGSWTPAPMPSTARSTHRSRAS